MSRYPSRKAKEKCQRLRKQSNHRDDLENQREEDCVICLDRIKCRGRLSVCNHWFCFICIYEWAKNTNTCPLCKVRFRCITKVSLQNGGSPPCKFRVVDRDQNIMNSTLEDYEVAVALEDESTDSDNSTSDADYAPSSAVWSSVLPRGHSTRFGSSRTLESADSGGVEDRGSTSDNDVRELDYVRAPYSLRERRHRHLPDREGSSHRRNLRSRHTEESLEALQRDDSQLVDRTSTSSTDVCSRESNITNSPTRCILDHKRKFLSRQNSTGWIDMNYKRSVRCRHSQIESSESEDEIRYPKNRRQSKKQIFVSDDESDCENLPPFLDVGEGSGLNEEGKQLGMSVREEQPLAHEVNSISSPSSMILCSSATASSTSSSTLSKEDVDILMQSPVIVSVASRRFNSPDRVKNEWYQASSNGLTTTGSGEDRTLSETERLSSPDDFNDCLSITPKRNLREARKELHLRRPRHDAVYDIDVSDDEWRLAHQSKNILLEKNIVSPSPQRKLPKYCLRRREKRQNYFSIFETDSE